MRVSHTGASTFSANSFNSSAASEITAPPPTKIYGRFASLIMLIAFWISTSLIYSLERMIFAGLYFSYRVVVAVTSFGISIKTGPGLPVFAILNALRIVFASSSIFFTIKLCFVIGIVTPEISTSWKLSFPRRLTPTLHVIATTGTESIFAVASPVTIFVAPGPLVAKHTPTFPVDLAYPSAA